jgi:hypothetical protein
MIGRKNNIDNFANTTNTLPVYYDITNSKYFVVKNDIRYDFYLNTNNPKVNITGLSATANIIITNNNVDTTIYTTKDKPLYNDINISPAEEPPPVQPPPPVLSFIIACKRSKTQFLAVEKSKITVADDLAVTPNPFL